MADTKSLLRTQYAARLPEWLAADSFAPDLLMYNVMTLDWLIGKTMAVYWSGRNEVPTRDIIRALFRRGLNIALPRVDTVGEPMSFRAWIFNDDADSNFGLQRDARNMWAPPASAPVVQPDYILVPLTAFDGDSLHRIGRGGGDFDRTLRHQRAINPYVQCVGLALAAQQAHTPWPVEATDEPLDLVVTERGVIRPRITKPKGQAI
jgi:5-formyltetrahydrofolate cyclo-ligase